MNELNRRRVLKLAMLTACTATCSGCNTNRTSSTPSGQQEKPELPESLASIKKEYEELRTRWMIEREDYSHHSHTAMYWTGPTGKAILAMGPRILPLIVKELRNGDFFFNHPMQVFAGFLLGGIDLDSEQARSRLWIKWYDDLSKMN